MILSQPCGRGRWTRLAVPGKESGKLGQGPFHFDATRLPLLQAKAIRVLHDTRPPLPVLPQPAHEPVERRGELLNQIAVAEKERLDRLPAEAVPQSPPQPEDRAGDPVDQGDAEQGRAPADEEDVGQHGKGDDGRQDLRQVSQGVKRCAVPARERRREKTEKEKKQEKNSQSGKQQPEKKEPSPERDTPGRAGLPPSRRVHGMILSIFPLSVSHRLVNSSSGRADARMASTAPRTSPIRARVW